MKTTNLISKMLGNPFRLPERLGEFFRNSVSMEPIFKTLGGEQAAYVRHYREACYVELVELIESIGLVDASAHPDIVQACLRDLIKGEILNKKEVA